MEGLELTWIMMENWKYFRAIMISNLNHDAKLKETMEWSTILGIEFSWIRSLVWKSKFRWKRWRRFKIIELNKEWTENLEQYREEILME